MFFQAEGEGGGSGGEVGGMVKGGREINWAGGVLWLEGIGCELAVMNWC